MTVSILDLGNRNPITLGPESRIEEAWKLMHDNHIRHIPVCKGDDVVGLVTQKDLLVNAQNPNLLTLPVAEIMVFNVRCIEPDTETLTAAKMMLDGKISCLPIIEGKALVGIVTESDLLGLLVSMLE